MFLIRPSALFLIVLMLGSCHEQKSDTVTPFKTSADSLNRLYSRAAESELPTIISVMEQCDSAGYHKGYAEASLNAYRIAFHNKKYADAIGYLEKAYQALRGQNLPGLEAKVELFFGLYHSGIMNYDIAYNYFIQSATKVERLKDTLRLAITYAELGRMFIVTQKWPLAKKYLYLARHTYSQMANDQANATLGLELLGVYHQRTGKIDSAEFFYDKAFRINEKTGNSKLLAQNLVNFGGFYADIAKYDSAEKFLNRSLELTRGIPDSNFVNAISPFIYTNLGVLYNRQKKYELAKNNLENAIAVSGPDLDLATRSNMYYEYYLCCKALEFNKEAYWANDRYIVLIDSIHKKSVKDDLMSLEMKYNYSVQQKEQIVRQQRLKMLLWGFGMMAGLIILVLILLYRAQRTKTRNANLQKKLLDEQLETRNRELASHMLNMVRMNERRLSLIKTLREELPAVNQENRQVIAKVIDGMEIEKDDRLWKEFEIRFTEVHQEFYTKLAKLNPNLTPNEKRLCAFLLLDMTTKDISYITGQSLKTLEQARYRLRKQLGITNPNVNLSVFLSSL